MDSLPSDTYGPAPRSWTVLSLLEWGAGYLEERGCDEARLHVDLLLAHVLHVPRLSLYMQFDRPLTTAELGSFKELFLRRAAREPLQYVLGETEFMTLRLKTDRRALIPRPETELLVEKVVAFLKGRSSGEMRVLDIGTGSGNIALAIVHAMPDVRMTALDLSEDALALAKENAEINGVHGIRWKNHDILQPWYDLQKYTLIVANPPYVSSEDYRRLPPEIRQFEPERALTDGGDGSSALRRVVLLAREILEGGGALFSEIAYNQEGESLRLAREAGLHDAVVHRDYGGHPRILEAHRGEEER
jgi:release factor glutamine methyltransferase